MDEAVLADLERELASPERRKAHEDRSQQERVDVLVMNSYLVQAVPDLVAEIRRLRAVVEELQSAPAEVVRLSQLLTEYGRHNEGCSAAFGPTYRCRCGWRDVEPEFSVQNETEEAGDGEGAG